jgi:hypothetical protein
VLTADKRPETDAREVTAADLVENAHTLPADAQLDDIVGACLEADDRDWLVLVDDAGRAVRIVDRAGVIRGEPFEHKAALVAAEMPLREVARRAATRPGPDRLRPLVCCDGEGRPAGLIRVDAVLRALVAEA